MVHNSQLQELPPVARRYPHIDTRTSIPAHRHPAAPMGRSRTSSEQQVSMSMISCCYENFVTVKCCMTAVWTCCGCFLWLWSLTSDTRCPNTRGKRFRTIIGGARASTKASAAHDCASVTRPWLPQPRRLAHREDRSSLGPICALSDHYSSISQAILG